MYILSYIISYIYACYITHLLGGEFSILIFFAFSQSCSLASYSILLSTQKLSGTVKYPIKESIDGNWRSIKQKSIMDLIWARPWRFDRYTYIHAHIWEISSCQTHMVNTICTVYSHRRHNVGFACWCLEFDIRPFPAKFESGIMPSRGYFAGNKRCAMMCTSVSYSLFPGNLAASDLRLAGDLGTWILHDVCNFRWKYNMWVLYIYISSFFSIFII